MNAASHLIVRSHRDLCRPDIFDEVGCKAGKEVVMGVVGFVVCVVQYKHRQGGSEGVVERWMEEGLF